jgi:hypothetical protein
LRDDPIAAAGLYTLLVLVALALTLQSLSRDDFDGLNNVLQLPLALPWAILPVSDHGRHHRALPALDARPDEQSGLSQSTGGQPRARRR